MQINPIAALPQHSAAIHAFLKGLGYPLPEWFTVQRLLQSIQRNPGLSWIAVNADAPAGTTEITAVILLGHDGYAGNIHYLAVKPELDPVGLVQLAKLLIQLALKSLFDLGAPKFVFVRAGVDGGEAEFFGALPNCIKHLGCFAFRLDSDPETWPWQTAEAPAAPVEA